MSELIDVLTPGGMFTGVIKRKPDIHRDGDWHGCAHVWVVRSDGAVLLQRRAPAKESWPDLWDISVTGHISAGESPVDAAIRETMEEIGLAVTADELTYIGTLQYQVTLRDDYIENEFHHVHIVRRDVDLSALTLDPLEVAEVRYVSLDELDRYDRVPHEEEYALLLTAVRGHVKNLTCPT